MLVALPFVCHMDEIYPQPLLPRLRQFGRRLGRYHIPAACDLNAARLQLMRLAQEAGSFAIPPPAFVPAACRVCHGTAARRGRVRLWVRVCGASAHLLGRWASVKAPGVVYSQQTGGSIS
jgi:hypothetical protein